MVRRAYNDPKHAHFLTFSCFHRRQFLTSHRIRAWLAESIDVARREHDFALWAYVFMPDHVHMFIHPRQDDYSIPDILRDIKLSVARKWIAHLHKTAPVRLKKIKARQGKRNVHRLWQAGGGYDRNLFNWETIERAISYIEWNPVTRGLVSDPKEWMWSSASARAGVVEVPLRVDGVDAVAKQLETVVCKP